MSRITLVSCRSCRALRFALAAGKSLGENRYLLLGVVSFALAVGVLFGFEWSKDAAAYTSMFDDLDLDGENGFPSSEIGFWQILFIGKSAGLSLQTMVTLLAGVVVFWKLRILMRLGGAPFSVLFVYILTYFFLHDVTQIRIGCAAVFALASCLFIEDRKFFFAFILAGVGLTFHLSSVALPFVYFFGMALKRTDLVAGVSLLIGLVVASLGIETTAISEMALNAIGGRYSEYGSDSFLGAQNTTGLAFPYAILQGALGLFFINKGKACKIPRVERMGFVACIGSAFALCFWQNIAVGVRVEELLGILLVPLISAQISSNIETKSPILYIWIVGVFLFGVFRFFYLFYY